jgi:hypothetical protein
MYLALIPLTHFRKKKIKTPEGQVYKTLFLLTYEGTK